MDRVDVGYESTGDDGLSIADLFRILKRRLNWIIITFVIVVIIGGLYLIVTKSPSYTAEASIHVKPVNELLGTSVGGMSLSNINNEMEYLTRDQLYIDTLNSLNLDSYLRKDGTTYADMFDEPNFDLQKYIKNFREKKLTATLIKDTSVIELSLTDSNPNFALDFLQIFIQKYDELLISIAKEFDEAEKIAVDQHLEEAEDLYARATEELLAFQTNSEYQRLVPRKGVISKVLNYLIPLQEELKYGQGELSDKSLVDQLENNQELSLLLEDYSRKYSQYLLNIITLVYAQSQAQQQMTFEIATGSVTTSDITYQEDVLLENDNSSQERIRLEKELSSARNIVINYISKNYSDYSPSSISDYVLRQAELTVVNQTESRYREDYAKIPFLEEDYAKIRTNYDYYRSKRQSLFDRSNTLKTTLVTQGISTIQPVGYAKVLEDDGNTLLILAVAVVLGGALGILAALAIEMMSPAIEDIEGLTKYLRNQIFVMSEIPLWNMKNGNLKYPALESVKTYNLLAGNLQQRSGEHGKNVIGVASSTTGEGTTFNIVNIGIALAKNGLNVLI
ncbi:MAG: Wzz/FepE/Etk N-terminal domain-containing protein, partial [Sphaerochaetaceae bacterium]